jgi:small subunit ribosomal protein S9
MAKINNNHTKAIGRRKTASSRVRLYKGVGVSMVNGKKVFEYFPAITSKAVIELPLKETELLEKYYFTAKVTGGGQKGQLKAVAHGLARAIADMDPEKYRKPLKRLGLLTRDSRFRLRRMVGTGGKARRQKQSPKR